MTATKTQLRKEIRQLRLVGQQMSNLIYNFSQNDGVLAKYRDLVRQWDKIERQESAVNPAPKRSAA